MALRTVGVRLTAEVGQYVANMKRAGESTKSFAQGLDKQAATGKLDAIADRAGIAGIALGGAAAYAVSKFAEFDKQMSAVKAATHASGAEMDKLRQAALKAGADTQYSATEAAAGIEELAKAGVSTADILGGGLKGALDLAAAGQMDVGAAAETAASALTQFKLQGKDVPHVADLLSAAAGKAQGSVADMGAALNQSGLIAAQTGLSIEDTTGTLAAFANAGLIGSDAGTSFKTMLQALQAPSGKTKELMDELGVSAYDAQGNFIGITALAGQLKSQLGKLTPELRANALAQIFGSDATRAASILYEQGAEGIGKWISKTNDAGFAAETAAIKTDNLAGDIERLKGSIDTLLISGGGGANGGLRVIAQALESMVDQFGKLPSGVGATVVVVTGLTAAVLLAAAGWVKARRAIASTVAELNSVGPAGARAATGLQAATKWAGRAAGAFIALEAANVVFDQFGNASVNVDRLTASLQDYANSGKKTEGLTDVFGEDLKYLGKNAWLAEQGTHGLGKALNDLTFLSPIANPLSEWATGTSIQDSTERMQALDESFTAFIGTQKDAKAAGALWNEILTKSGLGTEQLQALLPNASAAMTELQKASHAGAGAQGQLAAETQKSTEELEKQKEEAEKVKKAFDDLFDRYMTSDQAAMKYKETLISTNEELKKGSKTLSVNSDEGRKNRRSVLSMIDAINDQRTANINNNMSVEEADGKYRTQIETLGKTMKKMDFTTEAIEGMLGKYREIPDKVNTKVTVTGDSVVRNKLISLKAYQDALKQGAPVVSVYKKLSKDNADFLKFDVGGWTGPGDTHDEAGIVHADEFVVKKPSRRKMEQKYPGALDYVNEHGELPTGLPGYAGGGRVTWPYPVTAAGTKIPTANEVASAVIAAIPGGGGAMGPWIESAAKALVPGIRVISRYRPGARTLSGNVSLHASNDAVDFEVSKTLAARWDAAYGRQTTEFISPYQQYNRLHGLRHRYTGAVWNQHNFAGGNAHDHIGIRRRHTAMEHGGTIREPIVGVGASGRTYSFGEDYKPERVTPGAWSMQGDSGRRGAGTVVQVGAPTIVIQGAQQSPQQIAMAVNRELGALVDLYERSAS